jgi:hypothetical protein
MHAAVGSGGDENLKLMQKLQNYGVCWLQPKFMALWRCTHAKDARVMDVSEAAEVPLAMRRDAFRFTRLLVIRSESTRWRS